ncbi:MAG: flagellar basal body P-ring formation chaperone FlgA [Candidatus Hydrogenedens sp.]
MAIKSEVEVSSDRVMLNDVLDCVDTGFVHDIPLLPAPKPGYARVIPNTLIFSKMKQMGVNAESLSMGETGQTVVKRATTVISKDILVESLCHYIQQQMPWEVNQTRIEIYPPSEDLAFPEGDVEITWKPNNSYRYLGVGIFRGIIRVEGKVQKTIICRVIIETEGMLVIAVRDIPRGETITEKDITVRQMTLSRNTGTPIWDLNSVIGMSARKFIPSGATIQLEDIESPVIIKRNQIVPIEYTQGGISISAKVKVLSDARIGERVRCIYLNSEQQLDAVVQSDGTVKVE